jgi:hypothetical protein
LAAIQRKECWNDGILEWCKRLRDKNPFKPIIPPFHYSTIAIVSGAK